MTTAPAQAPSSLSQSGRWHLTPTDCLETTFLFLPIKDLAQSAKVCKSWRDLASYLQKGNVFVGQSGLKRRLHEIFLKMRFANNRAFLITISPESVVNPQYNPEPTHAFFSSLLTCCVETPNLSDIELPKTEFSLMQAGARLAFSDTQLCRRAGYGFRHDAVTIRSRCWRKTESRISITGAINFSTEHKKLERIFYSLFTDMLSAQFDRLDNSSKEKTVAKTFQYSRDLAAQDQKF